MLKNYKKYFSEVLEKHYPEDFRSLQQAVDSTIAKGAEKCDFRFKKVAKYYL